VLRAFFAAIVLASILITPAGAHEVKAGDLVLTDLWTRATPPKAPTGGGYLTITNNGTEADRLIAVASPLAEKGRLHHMTVKDGVMTMRPVESIEIPPGGSVTLAPGGFHLMFVGPKEPFKQGGKLPVTLTFEKVGTVETFLHIRPIGAPGPEETHDHDASQ
jgi:copper(I)-binding protein